MVDLNFDRILLILGVNQDKNSIMHIQEKISRDKDIKRLILFGKLPFIQELWSLIILVLIIISTCFILIITRGHTTLWSEIKEKGPVGICILGIIVFYLFKEFKEAFNWVKEVTEHVSRLRQFFWYALSLRAPHRPLEMWVPVITNISDAQVAFLAECKHRGKVSSIYSGQPYYQTKAIDSVTLQWEEHSFFEYIRMRHKYKKLFRKFSVQTLMGYTKGEKIKIDENKLQVSNSVFGILFMSKYLSDVAKNKSVCLKIGMSSDLDKVSVEFAKTFMEMASCPSKFYWGNDKKGQNDLALQIVSIDFLDDKVKQTYERTNKQINGVVRLIERIFPCIVEIKNQRIRVPVKRYISIPQSGYNTISTRQILPWNQLDKINKNNGRLFNNLPVFVGGAEHNLAFLYAINKHRWSQWQSIGDYEFGIAENAFDERTKTQFRIGTESSPYSISKEIEGKYIKSESSRKAEVCYFKIGELGAIFIYGYCAAMTKIASAHLFEYLKKPINSRKVPSPQKTHLTYVLKLEKDEDFYSSKALKAWDEEDLSNYGSIQDDYLKKVALEDLV
jgi:hypothetical protein